jgi:hypothetical protein
VKQLGSSEVESMAYEASSQKEFQSFMKDEREMKKLRDSPEHIGRQAKDADGILKSGVFEKPYSLRNHMMAATEGMGDHERLDRMNSAINIGFQAGAPPNEQDKYVKDQFDRMNNPKKANAYGSQPGISSERKSYLDRLNEGGDVDMGGGGALENYRNQFNLDDETARKDLKNWRETAGHVSRGKQSKGETGENNTRDSEEKEDKKNR